MGFARILPVLLVSCVTDAPIVPDAGMDANAGTDGTMTPDTGTGDDAEGGGDAGVWSPTVLGNDLALWLVADLDVTETAMVVSDWKDQSPQPVTFTQANANYRPTLEKGVANGHNVVNFTGGNIALASPPNTSKLEFGMNDDFVIAGVVAEVPSGMSTEACFLFMKADHTVTSFTDGIMLGTHLTNSQSEYAETRISSATSGTEWLVGNTLDDHNYHLVVARRVGATTLQIRVDMLSKTRNVSSFDVSEPNLPVQIGSILLPMQTAMGSFAFRVPEIVAVHRTKAINDMEVAALEGYLRAKYKTP